jgi:hypothetical protein
VTGLNRSLKNDKGGGISPALALPPFYTLYVFWLSGEIVDRIWILEELQRPYIVARYPFWTLKQDDDTTDHDGHGQPREGTDGQLVEKDKAEDTVIDDRDVDRPDPSRGEVAAKEFLDLITGFDEHVTGVLHRVQLFHLGYYDARDM